MRIITATEFKTMLGRYEVNYQDEGEDSVTVTNLACGPNDAAAHAMKCAIKTRGEYVIMGDKKTLDCIPEKLRQRLI